MAERIDRQELNKIKQVLSRISEVVKREARYCGIDVGKLEGTYGALRELYGELWWVLAAMYELLARKEGSGYNRKANYNPVGLLLSFALKDSPASFWDMARRFEDFYGVEVPAGKIEDDFLKNFSSPELRPLYELFKWLYEEKRPTYELFRKKFAGCRYES